MNESRIMKKTRTMPKWQKIVAGMVLAATAAIGSQAMAQTYERTDNGTGLWTDDASWTLIIPPGTNITPDAGAVALLGAGGSSVPGTLEVHGETVRKIEVTDGKWALYSHTGGITVSDQLTIGTDAELTLKENAVGMYRTNVTDVRGKLIIETGARVATSNIILRDGTLAVVAGGTGSTNVSLPATFVIGLAGDGGTVDIDTNITVTHLGNIDDGTGAAAHANFFKKGLGTLEFGGTVDLGTGNATFSEGITNVLSGGSLAAKNATITGAETVLHLQDSSTTTITDFVRVTNGGTLEFGTNALFGTVPSEGIYLNAGTLKVTSATGPDTASSSVNINVDTLGTIDVGADVAMTLNGDVRYAGSTNPELNKTGDGTLDFAGTVNINKGKATFTGGDVTISTGEYTDVSVVAGFRAGEIKADGVDFTLTIADGASVQLVGGSGALKATNLTLGTNASPVGVRTLYAKSLHVTGAYTDTTTSKVLIEEVSTFDSATTINASEYLDGTIIAGYNTGILVATSGLTIANDASVFVARNVTVDGNLTIGSRTTATLNNLRANSLEISGVYTDTATSATLVENLTGLGNNNGKATFKAGGAGLTASTILGSFTTWSLELENTVAANSIAVNASGAAAFVVTGNYTGGLNTRLDATTKDLNGLQNVTLAAHAGIIAKELTVNGAYDDEVTSKLNVANKLTFANGAVVNGDIANSATLEIIAKNAAGACQALTLNQGGTWKSIASGDLTFTNLQTYAIDTLDVCGNFVDNGAATNVTAPATVTAPTNAKIAGDATITGMFTSVGLDLTNGTTYGKLTMGTANTLDAAAGNIIVGDLDSSMANATIGNTILTTRDLDVKGLYTDSKDSNVFVLGEFKFTGEQTVKSDNFNAKTVHVVAGNKLTLDAGANVITGADSRVAGTLVLGNGSRFGGVGHTVTNRGTNTVLIESGAGTSYFSGNFDNQGKTVIGALTTVDAGKLKVDGNWVSGKDGSLAFVVDNTGTVGNLKIDGTAKLATGATNHVALIDEAAAGTNLYQLGKKLDDTKTTHLLVSSALTGSDNAAFTMNGNNNNLTKYDFYLDPFVNGATKEWRLRAERAEATPEASSFVLANIIGFSLPRAQNVSGPWARIKGGHLSDDVAQFDKMSFQTLQVGWDKSFAAANGNGNWYAGMFMEGDWMYGNGIYYRNKKATPVASGTMKSSSTGMGTGLYVSRGFDNGWYCDLLGRISLFDSKVSMMADPTKATNYSGDWTDKMFSLGIEIGKSFNSKDGRFSFNPYNRLLYNSTPGNAYSLAYDDKGTADTLVRNHAVDAWTNQLGARFTWNSISKGRTLGNLYVGADYYQGLSGKFGLESIDAANYKDDPTAAWDKAELGRSKNDLSYGMGTFGATAMPKENISIFAQSDLIFGDVSGWMITAGSRFAF